MALKTADTQGSLSSPILTQIIRNSLMTYLFSAVAVPVICFIFGWRSTENIGTGYIYGSLSLVLFGILFMAGNRVPFQLGFIFSI